MIRYAGIGFLLLAWSLLSSCQSKEDKRRVPSARKVIGKFNAKTIDTKELKLLSAYGFFEGNLADLNPAKEVYPYDINTPLFSNYAEKLRFIYLPGNKKMTFKPQGSLVFSEGTILIKNFFYTKESSEQKSKRQLVETRLLIKEKGKWKPLNYIWNEEQTDAELNYIGKQLMVSWEKEKNEPQPINYTIPNLNQCKNCHNANNLIVPIGVTAAQLNQRYQFIADNINQLDFFKSENRLEKFTAAKNYSPMPVWNDVLSGTLEERARAYLDANCAHCHSSQGSAKNAGLFLNYHEKDARKRGVFKPPIAAGKGSGDFAYDIVPGKPEESIIIYRVGSNDPAIRMPELGRSIVHQEGLELLTDYIQELVGK